MMDPTPPDSVAFAGLGAMGFGMASHLLKVGHHVVGFDIHEPALARFRHMGGWTSSSPREAAKEAGFFVCMVTNWQQVEAVLFDHVIGAVQGKVIVALMLLMRIKISDFHLELCTALTLLPSPSSKCNSNYLFNPSVHICEANTIKAWIHSSE
jgi:predicted dinucleotide-binding enzyme